jgi:hypothetical protein
LDYLWWSSTCGSQQRNGGGQRACTPSGDYLLASRIEMARMQAEEVAGLPLTPHQFDFGSDPSARDRFVDEVCGAGRWGSDSAGAIYSVATELTNLRVASTVAEQNRFASHGLATCRRY